MSRAPSGAAPPLSPSGPRFAERRGALVLFVKAPEPGRAKTRLAPRVGPEGAASLARAFLADAIALLGARADAELVLAVEPTAFVPEGAEAFARVAQGGGDLGARLERVLARALEERPFAIALGADSPGLPAPLLDDAIARLRAPAGPDAVLGPADDGGYYLLGVRRVAPGMLDGVRWSTEHALSDTERALSLAGLRSARAEPFFDVDEPEDLTRLARGLESGELRAPATRAALAHLGLLERDAPGP